MPDNAREFGSVMDVTANWEAIGAVGEVAGAIGVLISLIYLARQIRASNRVVWSQNVHSRTDQMLRMAEQQLDPEVRRALGHVYEGRVPSPADFLSLETYVSSALISFFDDYQHYQAGMLSDAEYEVRRKHLGAYLSFDWGVELWRTNLVRFYSADFANEIDGIIASKTAGPGAYAAYKAGLDRGE